MFSGSSCQVSKRFSKRFQAAAAAAAKAAAETAVAAMTAAWFSNGLKHKNTKRAAELIALSVPVLSQV